MARSFSHHPGERRGPVAGRLLARAALDILRQRNWAPAFAGVEFVIVEVAR